MNPVDLKKAYMAMAVTSYHHRMKQKGVEYKGGACQMCGYSKSLRALTFHHRNPEEKDFNISGTTRKWEKMRVELDKCDLLCSNCHIEEHARWEVERHAKLTEEVRKWIPERPEAQYREFVCQVCQVTFTRLAIEVRGERIYCSTTCMGTANEKAVWPSKEELASLVESYPVAEIGRSLGVDGNAVRKRCKKLGIAMKPRGYWQKVWALQQSLRDRISG